MLFISFPNLSTPLPCLSFPIILSVSINTITFEISARCRSCFPWSVNILSFFLVAWNKVFPKASLSVIMKEQVSRLAKSAVVQYVTVFRLILAKMTDCVRTRELLSESNLMIFRPYKVWEHCA